MPYHRMKIDYYHYCYFTLFWLFHTSVSRWLSTGLSDSKSPQLFRTLLSILADLNNGVVWMIFTRPLISKSPSPCTYSLVIVPKATFTISITVTFMSWSIFSVFSQGLGTYLSFCFPCGQLEYQSPLFSRLFFFYCWLSLGLIVWTRLHDPFLSQNNWNSYVKACDCVRIIDIRLEYLKPYNYIQTNDFNY